MPDEKNEESIREMLKKAMHAKRDPRKAVELDLLAPEDKEIASVAARSVQKRQCANCTCSLSKQTPTPKPKSGGCGSCALGDAFRCAGCPYRGMPAFEEGEEFKFDDNLNDL